MNQQKMVRIADILPPVEQLEGTNETGMIILLITIVTAVAIFTWYYYCSPLKQLLRHLQSGTVSPRSACHQLVQHINNGEVAADTELRVDLDRLRFQRQSPDRQQVIKIIQQVKRHA